MTLDELKKLWMERFVELEKATHIYDKEPTDKNLFNLNIANIRERYVWTLYYETRLRMEDETI
jgi:hypothetical protein